MVLADPSDVLTKETNNLLHWLPAWRRSWLYWLLFESRRLVARRQGRASSRGCMVGGARSGATSTSCACNGFDDSPCHQEQRYCHYLSGSHPHFPVPLLFTSK